MSLCCANATLQRRLDHVYLAQAEQPWGVSDNIQKAAIPGRRRRSVRPSQRLHESISCRDKLHFLFGRVVQKDGERGHPAST